jgi:hypothetical protein
VRQPALALLEDERPVHSAEAEAAGHRDIPFTAGSGYETAWYQRFDLRIDGEGIGVEKGLELITASKAPDALRAYP